MWIADAARSARGTILVIPLLLAAPRTASAQTDYFNTDRGRPLHVQDAITIERYAFELQAAPIRWSRMPGAQVVWSVEPELAYGIFPRTQIELGVPVYVTEGFASGPRSGTGAVHVSVLHALNVETLGFPALAVHAAALIPAGDLGPRRAYPTFGVLATRTSSLGRLHLNADGTFGRRFAADDDRLSGSRAAGHEDLARWKAGVAIDRALPLRSMLIGAEVVARQPLIADADVDWHAGAGIRWQLNPRWALDGGLARTLGDDVEWSFTLGAARSFGLIRFFPSSRK